MAGGVPGPTEVVRRAFEALNDRDRGTFLDLHSEEVVLHVGDATIRGALSVGEEEWAQFDAFPDLTAEPDQIITEDDTVAVRWTATGTHEGRSRGIDPTGQRVEYQLSGMFRVDDGRITEVWLVADRLALLQQIGAVDALTG